MEIISRRHFWRFHFTLWFMVVAFFSIGGFTIYRLAFFKDPFPRAKAPQVFIPFLGIAMIIMALYGIYSMFRNVPKIRLTETGLETNGVSFPWKDLEQISLTGERRSVFPHQNLECMSLLFADGKIRYLFPTLYANGPEIMSFLKQVVVDKKEYVPSPEQEEIVGIPDEEVEYSFRRNQFLSLRGLVLWGFIVMMATIIYRTPHPKGVMFLIPFMLFWLVVYSLQMYYFQVTASYLIIRAENLFWIKRVYRLDDIEEVVFETASKAPNRLRVITKQFREKMYGAGPLHDEDWFSLKQVLEERGIRVRNTCIPE